MGKLSNLFGGRFKRASKKVEPTPPSPLEPETPPKVHGGLAEPVGKGQSKRTLREKASILLRRGKALLDEDDLIEEPAGLPMLLLVGSLEGVSRRDAIAYCKGLIDKHVVAQEVAGFRVLEQKEPKRFVYEVQEGGGSFSILDLLLERLATEPGPVRLRLAQERFIEIADIKGEVVTLVFPSIEDTTANLEPPEHYRGKARLSSVIGQGHIFRYLSTAILLGAFLIFFCAATLYYISNADFSEESLIGRAIGTSTEDSNGDNPIPHLERAREDALKKGVSLKTLKKEDGKWTWELEQPK